MTDLVNFESEKKFSSVYLTEQINLFRRKEGITAIVAHSDFLKKIEKEFRDEINEGNISPVTYKDAKGEQRKCYELNFEQALQILMSESKTVRKAVIVVLKEKQHKIPQTYSAALMLAAKQAEQIELQAKEIKQLEPKADFYDTVTDSKDTIDIGSVAKVLNMGIGRNKLFKLLRDNSILMPNNQPYQIYVDRGYFRIIESKFSKPDGSTHISLKTVVYQKGVDFIKKQIKN